MSQYILDRDGFAGADREELNRMFGELYGNKADVGHSHDHFSATNNPHSVTAAQAGAPPTSRTISTTAPLSGGGSLAANRTLSITEATTSAAGSMSAADKTKLNGLNASDYAPASHVGSRDGHPLATTTQGGLQAGADKAKLDKIGTYANVRRDASLSVPSGSLTLIPMDAEVFDNGDFFALANASRFSILEGGLYEVGLSTGFSTISQAVQRVFFDIAHNDANGTVIQPYRVELNNAGNGNPRTAFSMPTRLESGHYVEFRAFQDSGASQVLTATTATIARLA